MSRSTNKGRKIIKVVVRRHGSTALSAPLRRAVQALARKQNLRLDLESAKEVAADKDVENASEWNSLLINARADRGPQWDVATQMFHVDKDSALYFDPTPLEQREEELPAEPDAPSLGNPSLHHAPSHLHPHSSQSQYQNMGNISLSAPSGYYETPPPLSSPQNHRVPPHNNYPQSLPQQPPSNPYMQQHSMNPSSSIQHHHPQIQQPPQQHMQQSQHAHQAQQQQQHHSSQVNGYGGSQSQYNIAPGQYFNGNVNLAQPASPVVNMGNMNTNGMGVGVRPPSLGRMPSTQDWMYGNGMM